MREPLLTQYQQDARQYATEHGVKSWIPVSAKKHYNVNYLFVSIGMPLRNDLIHSAYPLFPPARVLIREATQVRNAAQPPSTHRKGKHTQEIGGCKPWQLDSEATHCTNCKKLFTLVLRVHISLCSFLLCTDSASLSSGITADDAVDYFVNPARSERPTFQPIQNTSTSWSECAMDATALFSNTGPCNNHARYTNTTRRRRAPRPNEEELRWPPA